MYMVFNIYYYLQELEPDLMLTSSREKLECWDDKQLKYFTDEYPWLYFKET